MGEEPEEGEKGEAGRRIAFEETALLVCRGACGRVDVRSRALPGIRELLHCDCPQNIQTGSMRKLKLCAMPRDNVPGIDSCRVNNSPADGREGVQISRKPSTILLDEVCFPSISKTMI